MDAEILSSVPIVSMVTVWLLLWVTMTMLPVMAVLSK